MFRIASCQPAIIRAVTYSRRSISVSLPISKRVTRGTLDHVFEPEVATPLVKAVKKRTRKRKTAEAETQDLELKSQDLELKSQDLKLKPQDLELKPQSLEPKSESTGSVVLDTVRKYTKKHSECVLLVQVGDFYEVTHIQYGIPRRLFIT